MNTLKNLDEEAQQRVALGLSRLEKLYKINITTSRNPKWLRQNVAATTADRAAKTVELLTWKNTSSVDAAKWK